MSDPITTRYEMERAGYKFLSKSKCKGCDAAIEWWKTSRGKNLPFNPRPETEHHPMKPHWATCPKSDDFRQGATPKAPSPAPTIDAHQKYLAAFRASSNARVIIAIYDDGTAAAWRKGLSGEDLRHELITEANSLRNHIEKEQ